MPLRVVIAEDEAIIRMDLRETLEEEGYEVVGETGRGDQAVELVRALQPDLAILDIKMPGMDGVEAARIINGEKICGVLMLTAFSQREVVEEARDAGALAFLVKPFQKSDLIPAIEVAMGRFRELRTLTGEIDALGEQLEARKFIERAKGVLMDECAMTENDAFSFIQRTAMSERTRMRDVADRILDGSLRPGHGLNGHGIDGHLHRRRRQLVDVPGVLRAADRHGDGQRPGHQRRVRLHVDAHQRVEGPSARRRPGHVRPARADVPPRCRTRVQGATHGGTRHPAPADGPRPRGARRDRDHHDRPRGLGGRRPASPRRSTCSSTTATT